MSDSPFLASASVFRPAAPPAAPAIIPVPRDLDQASQEEMLRALQSLLADRYGGSVSGHLDLPTHRAVKRYLAEHGQLDEVEAEFRELLGDANKLLAHLRDTFMALCDKIETRVPGVRITPGERQDILRRTLAHLTPSYGRPAGDPLNAEEISDLTARFRAHLTATEQALPEEHPEQEA